MAVLEKAASATINRVAALLMLVSPGYRFFSFFPAKLFSKQDICNQLINLRRIAAIVAKFSKMSACGCELDLKSGIVSALLLTADIAGKTGHPFRANGGHLLKTNEFVGISPSLIQ